jgi:hypothetical protein
MNPEESELTIKEKLNLETAVLKWKELEIVFAQGKLLILDPICDLIEVASQISDSHVNQLEALIEKKLIQFATPDWIRENCNDETLIWTVVIAPYVISQLKVN